ncbi:MAG: hypothetical protein ACO35C_03930 [Pontimonas sp.]
MTEEEIRALIDERVDERVDVAIRELEERLTTAESTIDFFKQRFIDILHVLRDFSDSSEHMRESVSEIFSSLEASTVERIDQLFDAHVCKIEEAKCIE